MPARAGVRVLPAALALSVVLALPPALQGVDTTVKGVPRQLTVRFEGGLTSANYAEVMTALGHESLLPLTVYVDRDGSTPAEVLARTGRLAGSTVGAPLERYLCEINPQACRLVGKGTATRPEWRNLKAPADAPEPRGTCPDPGLPRYALCLPDVQVRPYKTSVVVPYNAQSESLVDIVTRAGGCAALDDRCRQILRELNRYEKGGADISSPRFAGAIRVPVQAYGVTLAIASAALFDGITRTIDLTIARLEQQGVLNRQQRSILYSAPSPVQRRADGWDPSQPVPPGAYLIPLLAMGYPYTTAQEFNKAPFGTVMVGIWDFHVDEAHCDFVSANGKAVRVSEPIAPDPQGDPLQPKKAGECGMQRRPLEPRWDHGTHVAGVIAARFGHGVAGVNPKAALWAYEIDEAGSRLDDDDDPISRLLDNPTLPRLPEVINISFTLPTSSFESRLEALIKAKRDRLFVAAAGNEGHNVSDADGCRVIPACLSTHPKQGENIISVVALDRDGKNRLREPKASNYGLAFDVAAVGEAVSTLHGDAHGVDAGTSIAAPYVTGLASLIYAKANRLSVPLGPRDVKERILATADFSETLDEVVRFGRINFTRALAFTDDTVTIKRSFCRDADCNPRAVTVKRALDEVRVTEALLDGDEIRNRAVRVKDIRRIAAKDDSPDSRYWIVFYDDVTKRLRKYVEARFEGNPVLRFRNADQPGEPISRLADYTCRTPCEDPR